MWILGICLWILSLLGSLILTVVGLLIIPLLLAFHQTEVRRSQISNRIIYAWKPKWAWIWGNEEDGLAPVWYANANPRWGFKRLVFMWAAIRNSCNNLGRVRYLNCRLLPSLLKSYVGKWGFICQQGPYFGGKLFIGSKSVNYGYAFIPIMSVPQYYTPNLRNTPYVSCAWSIGPRGTDSSNAAIETTHV